MPLSTYAFIGDEVTAAGFRLGGAEVHTPAAKQVPALFQRLRDEADLLILTAEAAAQVPDDLMRQAVERDRPLLLVIADAAGRRQPDDLAAMLRRQLGMSE